MLFIQKENTMKTLFEPVELGGIKVKNRLVRSATMERLLKEDGSLDAEKMICCYSALSDGGIGLIITGMVGVAPNGCVCGMVKGYEDSFLPEMKAVVEKIHSKGTPVVVQLSHCGAKASAASVPAAPSDIEYLKNKPAYKMSRDEIRQLAADYAKAASICKQSGADGVQLHAAHGYLFSEFLSPYFNRRGDEYGGNIECRARPLFETVEAVINEVGKSYPIWVKINGSDLVDEGISYDEVLWLCRRLEELGIRCIEVSSGIGVNSESRPPQFGITENSQGPFFETAKAVSDEVGISVISVCGYRSYGFIEKKLNESSIQAISMSRPLIREPGLPNRWLSGDLQPSDCRSCNLCSGNGCVCAWESAAL